MAATEIDGIYYTFSGSGSSAYATVTYNTTTEPGTYSGSIVIPESVTYDNTTYPVTTIGYQAFCNSTGLTSVTIPASITSFGTSAFSGCTVLAEVIYNATSLNDLFNGPFSASTAENFTVSIGNNVTKLPNYIFAGLTHLTTISIPASVGSIGNYAFQGCTGLTTLPMGSSVTTIGDYAFKGCSGITSITIPSNVTSIGRNAFENCTGLTEINYYVTTHDDFTKDTKPFKGCSDYSSTTNIALNIGFNVTNIPAFVFNGAKVAGDVVIPSSVTNIGESSFINGGGSYTSITTVYMLSATPPTLANADIFKTGYNAYNCNIKVLYSSDESILNAYKEATYWSTYVNTISEAGGVTVTNMDLTGITTPVTIPAGNKITITGTLTNTDASKLIIEDGAQLICTNSVPATVKKTIADPAKDEDYGHWYTIATPVHKGSTDNVVISETNLISMDPYYDMFYLNEEQGKWINQKASGTGFSNMYVGKGYLYRNDGTDLVITGNTTVSDLEVSLTKTEGPIEGLNLIGNPFPHNIYIGTECALRDAKLSPNFYYLSNHGTWQTGDYETPITPGMGIIVQTSETGNITIYDTNKNYDPSPKGAESATELQFILNGNQYQDIAYAVLNEGYGLSKLEHPNEAAPMLFINHNDKNYAVAHMNSNTRSFNLGLSAKSFGQYTLKYKAKGNVKYLHVIDRLTGNDVDMLLEGEYSFIASPTDNENRFLVVLESLEALETLDGTFAYQNGNDIIVNGEGNLQIFDVMGRLIASQRVNGVETVNVSTTGVYIFKLNEKTQKIVVR